MHIREIENEEMRQEKQTKTNKKVDVDLLQKFRHIPLTGGVNSMSVTGAKFKSDNLFSPRTVVTSCDTSLLEKKGKTKCR